MCFSEGSQHTLLSGENQEKFDIRIRNKWLHCLNCPPCTIRYSMIQMSQAVRPLDMRVCMMEFTKAINSTVQYAQIGDRFRRPGETHKKPSIDAFMRTGFGIQYKPRKFNPNTLDDHETQHSGWKIMIKWFKQMLMHRYTHRCTGRRTDAQIDAQMHW